MMTVAAVAAVAVAWAGTETVGDYTWTYSINGDTAEISGVSPSTGAVTIPSTLSGKPVTSIGSSAFSDCSGLTSVTIPDSVTSIGSYSFSGCNGLTSVTIPDSVTSIGNQAFYNCSGLTSVTIPNSVTNIGEYAFYNCSGIKSVTVPQYVLDRHLSIFSSYQSITNVAYSGVITNISASAFYYCSALTSVTIPDSVTSIGDYAFYDCSGLTSVTIPESVTSIGESAFENCSDLKRTVFGGNCPSFESDNIFHGGALCAVYYKCGKEGWQDSLFDVPCYAYSQLMASGPTYYFADGQGTFLVGVDPNGATDIVIPDGVTRIANGMDYLSDGEYLGFHNCTNVTRLSIPSSMTDINVLWGCFGGFECLTSFVVAEDNFCFMSDSGLLLSKNGAILMCVPRGLTSVTIPDSVKDIGNAAFADCRNFVDVTIPNGVTNIWYGAFDGCSASLFDTTTIPGVKIVDGWVIDYTDLLSGDLNLIGVRGIGSYAFEGCVGLTSVTIPDSVKSIGVGAFAVCDGLGEVVIPTSVQVIGDYAFEGCVGLTSVTIPDSVKSIGVGAFAVCDGLGEVVIPTSVQVIGDYAFEYCISLARAIVPTMYRQDHGDIFDGCPCYPLGIIDRDVNVTVADGVVFIYTLDGEGNAELGGGFGGLAISKDTTAELVIPSVFDGHQVAVVGQYAFCGCSYLESVTIPDSVTSIGYSAFEGCSGLTSVTIPGSVTNIGYAAFEGCSDALFDTTTLLGVQLVDSWAIGHTDNIPENLDLTGVRGIGDYAFYGCGGLASVAIPDSVLSIGDYAFGFCSGLMSFTVGHGNPNYLSENGLLLSKDGKTLIQGVNGDVTIPDCVTNIVDFAFSGCSGLTSVTIPDSVTSVGDGAFYGCSGLREFVVGENNLACNSVFGLLLTKDGKTLVAGVNGDVVIPDCVTSIGDEAFYGCSGGLTSVTIPGSVTNIGYAAFEGCSGLTSVTIPDSVTSIGDYAFSGCSGLMSVTVPDSVTSIGDLAFADCSGLTSVTIGNGVQEIGSFAFDACSELTSVILRGGEFSGYYNVPWDSLDRVYSSPVYIGNWSSILASCGFVGIIVPLESWTIQTEVVDGTNWRYYTRDGGAVVCAGAWEPAVDDSGDMEEISIPAMLGGCPVTEIGFAAFVGLYGLMQVTIPETVTNIADYAFYSCSSLMTISIPSAVRSIGNYAFAGCSKLESALFAEPFSLLHIGDAAFQGCYSMKEESFTVPPTVVAIGKEALQFYLPKSLSGIIFGNVWLKPCVVYEVSGDVTIANSSTLTIPAGTVLKFANGCSLSVLSGATLNAQGTRAEPVVFTSIKDDKFGGDTNRDGEKTMPEGGDWGGIWVSGKANIAYAIMMYSGNGNERGIIQTDGSGALTMTGCTVAHALNDGVWNWGGTISVTNTVFFDLGWATAPYNGTRNEYVNCVFYGNDVGMCYWSGWSGKPVYRNCVFANCANGWCELGADSYGAPPSSVSVAYSLFWNPVGYGSQSCLLVGSNGNVWGDPLFADPANDDFRIQEGSACVDAADGTAVPKTDFYGQPRVTLLGAPSGIPTSEGCVPDIGICEVMPRNMSADVDFEARRVTAAGPVAPGDEITVKWTVGNLGGREVDGSWRDTVSLVSANGRVVTLGEKVTTGRVPAGGSIVCSGSFTVPTLAEGTWYPKVQVNTYRDVFEGSLTENNAVQGTYPVEVSVAAADMSAAVAGRIVAGVPTVLKLPFAEDASSRLVRMTLPEGVTASWGFGFMPTTGGSPVQSGGGVSDGHDVCFLAPDGEQTVYVVLESGATADYSLTFEDNPLVISSISPTLIPKSGTTSIIVTGAGFTPSNTVSFTSASGAVAPESVRYVNANTLVATVDCAKFTSATTYAAETSVGVLSSTLPSALSVTDEEGKGEFWAKLYVPDTVRKGRVCSCYVEYGNSGNVDVDAAVLEVVAVGESALRIHGEMQSTNILVFVAASDQLFAGALPSGYENRIYFELISGGDSLVKLSTSETNIEVPSLWPSGDDFLKDIAKAATTIANRGYNATDFQRVYDFAAAKHRNEFSSAIVGKAVFANGLVVPGVTVRAVLQVDTNVIVSAVSRENGFFSIEPIVPGIYDIQADGCVLRFPYVANVLDDGDVLLGEVILEDRPSVSFVVKNASETTSCIVERVGDETVSLPYESTKNVFKFSNLETNELYRVSVSSGDRLKTMNFLMADFD